MGRGDAARLGLSPRMFYDPARFLPRWTLSVALELGGATERERIMKRMWGAGIFLTLAALLPAQQAVAQDPLAGAIVGGAIGGILGGAVGRGPGGAVAGAVIGAAAGATNAAE